MNNFDLGRMLMKFTNTTMFVNRQQPLNSPVAEESFVAQTLNQNILPQANTGKINVQMNTLQSIDMAVYAREIMQLPRNLNELIIMIKKVTINIFLLFISSPLTSIILVLLLLNIFYFHLNHNSILSFNFHHLQLHFCLLKFLFSLIVYIYQFCHYQQYNFLFHHIYI